MTRAQFRVYNRLRKKQVNHNEVSVVEVTESAATFHVPFPGLFLTYGTAGDLVLTETEAERKAKGKPLREQQLGGEMGSDTKGLMKPPPKPLPELDDDVPF